MAVIWTVIRVAICIGQYEVGILYIVGDRDNISHAAECIECSDGSNKCDAHGSIRMRIPSIGITIEISAAL